MSSHQHQHAIMMIGDAVEYILRPMQALQAVEQLIHPSKAVDGIDLSLVDREALGYLMTTIHEDLANAVAGAQAAVKSALENSKTSFSAGDVAAAPTPPVYLRPTPTCRHRKE